jgi:hypothetical protein
MLFKSLVIILLIGTVLTINLKHNKSKVSASVARTAARLPSIVSTAVARVTAVNTLVIQINGTIDQLESILESTVSGSDAQLQQAVKETVFVFKNLIYNLEESVPKLKR